MNIHLPSLRPRINTESGIPAFGLSPELENCSCPFRPIIAPPLAPVQSSAVNFARGSIGPLVLLALLTGGLACSDSSSGSTPADEAPAIQEAAPEEGSDPPTLAGETAEEAAAVQPDEAPPSPQNILLRRPPIPDRWADYDEGEASGPLLAMAYQFAAPVYDRPAADPEIRGIIRRGIKVRVASRAHGPGCRGGRWYNLEQGGVVCTSDGFRVAGNPEVPWQRHANLQRPLPYDYAMIVGADPRRFGAIPGPDVLATLASAATDGAEGPLPGEALVGDYFVAGIRQETDDEGNTWLRTARGEVVPAANTEAAPRQTLAGEHNEEGLSLPIAFVHLEDRPVFDLNTEGEVGIAQKHARFAIAEERSVGGIDYVLDAEGHALRRDQVRVIRSIARPERIPGGAPWIHVDLAEQTLTAYDGDNRPVYATLVSSGKEGYDTPRGTFRIREKYASITMNGDDPIDGFYEVEEVPWTLYYFQSYALHGAYWHDDFGQVRSHGCTNIAPADARWLYEWSTPRVPEHWHGRRLVRGTWVHNTR